MSGLFVRSYGTGRIGMGCPVRKKLSLKHQGRKNSKKEEGSVAIDPSRWKGDQKKAAGRQGKRD